MGSHVHEHPSLFIHASNVSGSVCLHDGVQWAVIREKDGITQVSSTVAADVVSKMDKFTKAWTKDKRIDIDKNPYAIISGQYCAYVIGGNHHLRAVMECLAAEPHNKNYQQVEVQFFWGLDNMKANNVRSLFLFVWFSNTFSFGHLHVPQLCDLFVHAVGGATQRDQEGPHYSLDVVQEFC